MQLRAVWAIRAIGATATPAVPILRSLLEGQNAKLQLAAAEALGMVQGHREEAAAKMRRMAEQWNMEWRWRAQQSLVTIGVKDDDLVHELAAALQGADKDRRRKAAELLTSLGKDARPELQALIGALEDDSDEVSYEAARALGRIGGVAAIPALIEALDRHGGYTANYAIGALVAIGRPAVEPLSAVLERDGRIAKRAADTLAKIGRDAAPAATALIAVIKDRANPVAVRQAAISALGAIGPAAAEAVPLLRTMTTDPRLGSAARQAVNHINSKRSG